MTLKSTKVVSALLILALLALGAIYISPEAAHANKSCNKSQVEATSTDQDFFQSDVILVSTDAKGNCGDQTCTDTECCCLNTDTGAQCCRDLGSYANCVEACQKSDPC